MEFGRGLYNLVRIFWHGIAPPKKNEYETDEHYYWRLGITAYWMIGGLIVIWHVTRAAGFHAIVLSWFGLMGSPGYASAEDIEGLNANLNRKTHGIQMSVNETNMRLDRLEGSLIVSAISSLRSDYCEAVRRNDIALAESLYSQIEILRRDYEQATQREYPVRGCL